MRRKFLRTAALLLAMVMMLCASAAAVSTDYSGPPVWENWEFTYEELGFESEEQYQEFLGALDDHFTEWDEEKWEAFYAELRA